MAVRRTGRRLALATALAVLAVAATTTVAWIRRTAPPWPAVVGVPYEIPLAADGCPAGPPDHPFVDAPGQLVPPGATEVVLCTIPTGLASPATAEPPRQRVLRSGVGEFTDMLNQQPDRNTEWRRWQRRHSGWWPDAAPLPFGEACVMLGYDYEYSYVVRYPDRPPVPLIAPCGGLTSGTRTRMADTRGSVLDEFLRRYQDG